MSWCDYCTVIGRNPCRSREEALSCGNCNDRASLLDFKPRDVAEWLRTNAHWGKDEALLLKAADMIEKDLL